MQAELRSRHRRPGEFDVEDVEATSLAILSLCIDVARWHGVLRDRLSA